MKFTKYESIENHYREKTVDYIRERGLSGGMWCQTLKIHGANYSLTSDGNEVLGGKRSGFRGTTSSFMGDHNFNHDAAVRTMFEYLSLVRLDIEQITLHGEIFGGQYRHPDVEKVPGATRVQKEVQYCPENRFIVFDIRVNDALISWFQVEKLCLMFGIETVPQLATGTFEDLIMNPVVFQDPLHKRYGLPAVENNEAEGWVLKPIIPAYFDGGERVILKGKNASFSERKPKKDRKPVKEMSKEGQELYDELLTYINENRLRNVLSHGDEIGQKEFGKLMGLLAQDAFHDFLKDNEFAFDGLDKGEQKRIKGMMNRECSNVIRPNFLNIIDKTF